MHVTTKRQERTGQPAVGARVDVPDVLRDRVLVGDGGRLVQVLVDGRDHLRHVRACVRACDVAMGWFDWLDSVIDL